jgi:predicted DNA-binding transcriptional regulator AlpA
MIKIMGENYLNEKQAAERYGYSRAWFQRERWAKKGPPFIKINSGKILYKFDEIEAWFKKMLENKS